MTSHSHRETAATPDLRPDPDSAGAKQQEARFFRYLPAFPIPRAPQLGGPHNLPEELHFPAGAGAATTGPGALLGAAPPPALSPQWLQAGGSRAGRR